MKLTLPVLLSLVAGYVDTAGFLALHGLFTAHVTGNFVTVGAAIWQGPSGAVPKLIALPVFCAVVIVVRLVSYRLEKRGLEVLRTLLLTEVELLVAGGALAIGLGPFFERATAPILATGMVLVTAMAIQNAAHRIHFASAAPTTLMTGTTTQIMIDVADLIHGVTPEATKVARARLLRMSQSVLAFAVGCGGAALLFGRFGEWCFALPPVLAACAPFLPAPETAAKGKS